jgi:CrcB protein
MRSQPPVDPDVDLHEPGQRIELRGHHPAILGAISVGGAAGALVRYGLGLAFPAAASAFPWTTFAINAVGCLLIGFLMVLVTDVWPDQRLIRPFFGAGLLGGFTTFSTYVVDIQRLLSHGAPVTALIYLTGTVLAALLAAWAGLALGRAVVA